MPIVNPIEKSISLECVSNVLKYNSMSKENVVTIFYSLIVSKITHSINFSVVHTGAVTMTDM